jgi:hypothetical protein
MTSPSGYVLELLRQGAPFTAGSSTATNRRSWQWHSPQNGRRLRVSGGLSMNTRSQPISILRGQHQACGAHSSRRADNPRTQGPWRRAHMVVPVYKPAGSSSSQWGSYPLRRRHSRRSASRRTSPGTPRGRVHNPPIGPVERLSRRIIGYKPENSKNCRCESTPSHPRGSRRNTISRQWRKQHWVAPYRRRIDSHA